VEQVILERIDGQTLREAWPKTPSHQKSQIANQIAMYCSKLAAITSLTLESATRRGVLEPFSTLPAEPSHPSWKPRPLAPLSLTDFTTYLSHGSTPTCLNIGPYLHFYHVDLDPGNIMVSEEGNVEGVLDWEFAGFLSEILDGIKPDAQRWFLPQLYGRNEEGRLAWSPGKHAEKRRVRARRLHIA
jgi:thiamine kinase-like enzyme